MTSIRDDGVHRHLRFRRRDSICYYFDLITWPGKLCISGDCGTWVFARIEDKGEFFRTDECDCYFNRDGGLSINPGYSSEKLLAVDNRSSRGDSGPLQYSETKLADAVRRRFDEWTDGWEDDQAKADLFEALEEDVLNAESEEDAHRRAADVEKDGFRLPDFWEEDLRDWTFSFIWKCCAIAWAVQQYDARVA